jgi:hypothetical protein
MIQPLAHTRSSRATYPRQEHAQSTHERVKGQKSLRQALSRLSGDSLTTRITTSPATKRCLDLGIWLTLGIWLESQ